MALIGWAEPARGIDITLIYDNANSLEPSYDPAGAQLTVLMNHIKAVYEDIFEDSHSLTVTYRWADLAPGVGGLHSLLSQSGGRENSMLVQLNSFNGATEVAWFMDPTPANDSEFNMSQTLFRDLTATQRTNFYNAGANIPQTFEVGYQGPATASAPASAQNNPDGLSVMFQEVGHGLGMSAANTTTQTETGDDDYDFDSVNVFGATLAADTRTSTDFAHLADPFAVMFGSAGTGQRTRPGHTDLFAMAAVHNYVNIDLPRNEFYGGSNWNTSTNWAGNSPPGIFDEAYVRASGPNGEIRTAGLSAAGFANILHIHEGSNVDTNTFSLSIATLLDLDGLDTDMFVSAGGTLSVAGASININNQAELNMAGGVISSVGTINNNAEIIGNGTINVSGRLNNSGSINVSGGTLVITATGTGSLNLDGFSPIPLGAEVGAVLVTAANTDLVVTGSLTDEFNGVMTIGNSNSVTMNDPWVLGGNDPGTISFGNDGVLNLNGGTTSATGAVLTGAIVTVQGDINVGTNGFGNINAATVFIPGATVVVNTGATLDLNGNNSFNGGSYTGDGSIQFDGNTTIIGDTTFDVANFDFDGGTIVDTFTINNGVTMTVNGNVTDDYDDNLNVLGSLIVNGPSWGINTGTVTLNTGTIGGTAGFRNGSGNLVVLAGDSFITTSSTFFATSTNTITGRLRLGGNATILGGTWTGAGALSLDDQATTFTGNTTLNVDFDMDGLINGTGTVNINSGVVVTANNGITDVFNATLNVNSGSLVVNSAGWSNSGDINLSGTTAGVAAAINGQPLTNNVGGRINMSGGTNSPGISGDADGDGDVRLGGTGGARIATGTFVNAGSINVATNSFGAIVGNITFNGTSNVTINTGGELSLQGPTTYNGGTYSGPGTLTQDTGAMVVAANTTIGVTTYDWDGGDIGAFSTTTINSGVTFTINSNVIEDEPNSYDSTITVNSGSLTVNTLAPWPLTGTLNLTDTAAADPTLSGMSVRLNTGGAINVTNGAQIPAGVQYVSGTINTISSVTVLSGPLSSVGAGVLNKTGVAQLNINGAQSHAAGAQLNILGGTVVMNTDAGGGGQNLIINHSGTSLSMSVSQRVAQLNINAGATATLAGAGGDNVLRTNVLSIAGGAAPTATLNLTDENMIIDYAGASPLTTIRAQLASGRNGGAWNGLGLRSSTAAAAVPKNTALGYAEASSLLGAAGGMFFGQSVDGTSLLVKYTYYGDTDLNGVVDFDDYSRTDNGFNTAGNTWFRGDFDYNAIVDFDDYSLIDMAFNTQSGTLRRAMTYLEGGDRSTSGMDAPALQLVMEHFEQFGVPYAISFYNAVPEPTSLALCAGLATFACMRRRRRR
jgi:hypothetical protein